jgi:hypothetical protein
VLETQRHTVQSLSLIGRRLLDKLCLSFPLFADLHTLFVPILPYLWHNIDKGCPSLCSLTVVLIDYDVFDIEHHLPTRLEYVHDVVVIFRRILSKLKTFRSIACQDSRFYSDRYSRHLFTDTFETTTTGQLVCEDLEELVLVDDFVVPVNGMCYPDAVVGKLIAPKLQKLSISHVRRDNYAVVPCQSRHLKAMSLDFETWFASKDWLEIDPFKTKAFLLDLKRFPLEQLHLPNHTLDEDNFPVYLSNLHTVAFTLTESSKMIPVLHILRNMPKMREVIVYIRAAGTGGSAADVSLPKGAWYVTPYMCWCQRVQCREGFLCDCPSHLRLVRDVENKRRLELNNRVLKLNTWNAAVHRLRQSTIVHQIVADRFRQHTLLMDLSLRDSNVFDRYSKPIHGISFGELISPTVSSSLFVEEIHRVIPIRY